MDRLKKYFTKTLAVSILAGVFVFLFCKFFVVDIARVNSTSMSGALKSNSLVFVRPLTFLSSNIQANDVVEIQFPFVKNDTIKENLFFKRIIALPGDTINIQESVLYVNGKEIEVNSDLLHNYVIKLKQQKDTSLFEEEKITEKYLIDDSCAYLVTLTSARFLEIKSKGISIIENKEDSGLYDETIFPHKPNIKWNKDFFGPLYIPRKNDTIMIDTSANFLYADIINRDNLITKDGKSFYVVEQNYYFAIGDNFDNAIDSRHWGFIPQKAIRAKVLK